MSLQTKKFLDQSGVSHLWGKVVSKIAAEAERATAAENALSGRLDTAEGKLTTLTGAANVAGSVAEAKAAADAA